MSKRKGEDGVFDGRHFDREIIVLCVRWYLRYKLSLRDPAEMMAERGLSLAHTTIMRWVKRFTPEFVRLCHGKDRVVIRIGMQSTAYVARL